MAFTKVTGPGIHTLANITSHNINSSGIITATKFVGPLEASSGSTGTFDSLTVTGNVSVGGTLTYEDVTNIDAVGIITARSTIDAQGDISIADKIIHTGDTNTAIRFPAADTITAETAGGERLRITSAGIISINDNTPETFATLQVKNHTTHDHASLLLHGADLAQILLRDDTGGTNEKIITIRNDEGVFLVGTHNDAYGNWQEKFRITNSGNCGLGTATTSGALLSIETPSGTSGNNTTKRGLRVKDGGYADGQLIDCQDSIGDSVFAVLGTLDTKIYDNHKLLIGNGDDLQIYHDGTNSWINNTTGALYLKTAASNAVYVLDNNDDTIFSATDDGATKLYFDNSPKLQTLTNGVQTDGSHFVMDGDGTNGNPKFACGNSADLNIYHNGTNSYIANSTGPLIITQHNNDIHLRPKTAEEGIIINNDGAVELYYDNEIRISTTDSGALIEKNANGSEANPHLEIYGLGYRAYHWLDGTAYYLGQNSNNRELRIYSGSDETSGAQLSHGGTSWTTFSDERLKEDIKDIGSVIDKVKDIRCISYKRKNLEGARETIGFIAQDFVGKFDQVLDQSKLKDDDTEEYYGIKYTETIPILLKAIQELSAEVGTLKTKVAALEAK